MLTECGIDAEPWLELGLAGAALFIILIVVLLMFRQQGTSVDKLCSKIDELVTSFADNNLKLNEVIVTNDKDQKEVLHQLTDMSDEIKDMHRRIVRIDTRLVDGTNREVD